ncbi:MAG: hypothetical protein MUE87_00170 [Methanothrix sp.]|jgi:hypothetical protein|nr:hypothetical protein [Methanothrix sp.]
MDNIAIAPLNSFASTATQNDFPVSPVVTIPAALLQELLGAVQDLKEEVAALREGHDKDRAELAAMRQQIAASEQWQATLSDNQYTQLQIINQLRETTKKETTPGQKDRVDILHALIAANGGKMLAKDARQKMHLQKNQFSLILAAARDRIEIKPLHSDRRKLVLCQIGSREP